MGVDAETNPGAMNKKPKSRLHRMVNAMFVAVLMLAGPGLMAASYQQVDADEELARTGVQVSGTITYFSDARKASNRDITVEYVAADGVSRYTSAPVDHEQHPSVGEQVTVAYREQNPEQAVVLGYESNSEFLGGVGLILTAAGPSSGPGPRHGLGSGTAPAFRSGRDPRGVLQSALVAVVGSMSGNPAGPAGSPAKTSNSKSQDRH